MADTRKAKTHVHSPPQHPHINESLLFTSEYESLHAECSRPKNMNIFEIFRFQGLQGSFQRRWESLQGIDIEMQVESPHLTTFLYFKQCNFK